jgi:hypothetical protein
MGTKAPDSLVRLNKDRKMMDLPPVIPVKKICLRCNKEFLSLGTQHRTCGCNFNK